MVCKPYKQPSTQIHGLHIIELDILLVGLVQVCYFRFCLWAINFILGLVSLWNISVNFPMIFVVVTKTNKTSLRFLVFGRLQNRCGDAFFLFLSAFFFFFLFFFWPTWKYVTQSIRGGQISHKQRPDKSGERSCEKSFKTQHIKIPIDSAILAAIGHRFIEKRKKMPQIYGIFFET